MDATAAQVIEMIGAIHASLSQARDQLNDLDAALGDGDHGTGIATAFAEAMNQIKTLADPTPSDVLRVTSVTLMNRMGGSSGALYGTLFLKACLQIKNKHTINEQDFAVMWMSGLNGVIERGKSQVGGKTLLDALAPAATSFEEAVENKKSLVEAFAAAASAAREGANRTAEMQAEYGRAKFVGERSIGHVDAGATSIALMFEAMYGYWKGQDDAQT